MAKSNNMKDLLKQRMSAAQQVSEMEIGNRAYESLIDPLPVAASTIRELPIDKLRPFFTTDIGFHPYPPEKLRAFAQQLLEQGLLERIIVRSIPGSDEYEILAGHNRTAAWRMAGHDTIPAEVVAANDARAIIIATATNLLRRQELTIIERGKAYKAMNMNMNHNAKDQVLSLLRNYRATKRKIEQLRYELEHPARVTPDEMIEAMNFAKGDGEGRPSGSVSNKTLYIAMNFQSAADEANAALTHDLVSRLVPLEQEINRLEHYVALLEPRQTEVIRRIFFDSQSLPEICKEMGYSTKTVRAIRNHAIEELAAMYEFAAGVI